MVFLCRCNSKIFKTKYLEFFILENISVEDDLWDGNCVDVCGDGYVQKLEQHPENYTHIKDTICMATPYVDKLQPNTWMFQESDEYLYHHPSKNLVSYLKSANV